MVILEDPSHTFIETKVPLTAEDLRKLFHSYIASNRHPADTRLPERVVIDAESIGALGYVSGPQVYIYDSLSLANPIGSHATVAVRGIPGHEKLIDQAWMVARFGVPGMTYSDVHLFGLTAEMTAARRALDCEPLKSYLSAITKPLSFSQALSNVVHSFTYTRMSFSPDPNNAATDLCGG